MTEHRAAVGMCFHRTLPPALVTEFARRLDAGGADQLWLIEDCFFTAGPSLAGAALSVTDRLTVGVGILPVVARTAPMTAMEIATLCGLGPGRVLPGIGHGVQSWMAQMGVRAASPLTAFEEVNDAVRRLLAGEEVSVEGTYVRLDRVRLDQPPAQVPPILAGMQGPKSLALAGRVSDGIVLAEPASPSYVRQSLDHAGRPDDFHVAVFSALYVAADRVEAFRAMAPWLARQVETTSPVIRGVPFFDDLKALYDEKGADGLAGVPADWWAELGAVGTMDDALAHVAALEAAGVDSIGFWPSPDPDVAAQDIDQVIALATR
jgi:5,10-methylenetetrahydromethanopterin reductase